MRMHVDAVGKTKKVAGSVYVPEGAVREFIKGQGAGQIRARFSSAALEDWYEAYVRDCLSESRMPSRAEDVEAASKAFGMKIPRNAVRELRKKHAPGDWTKPGRRPDS
jgi:hypothetical protein